MPYKALSGLQLPQDWMQKNNVIKPKLSSTFGDCFRHHYHPMKNSTCLSVGYLENEFRVWPGYQIGEKQNLGSRKHTGKKRRKPLPNSLFKAQSRLLHFCNITLLKQNNKLRKIMLWLTYQPGNHDDADEIIKILKIIALRLNRQNVDSLLFNLLYWMRTWLNSLNSPWISLGLSTCETIMENTRKKAASLQEKKIIYIAIMVSRGEEVGRRRKPGNAWDWLYAVEKLCQEKHMIWIK